MLNAHKHRHSKRDSRMYVWPPSHLHFRHSPGRKAPKREERGKKRCTAGTDVVGLRGRPFRHLRFFLDMRVAEMEDYFTRAAHPKVHCGNLKGSERGRTNMMFRVAAALLCSWSCTALTLQTEGNPIRKVRGSDQFLRPCWLETP